MSCSRRVASLAPGAADRGPGADVGRICRLQRRHVDAPVAKFILQIPSRSTRSRPAAWPRNRRDAASCRNMRARSRRNISPSRCRRPRLQRRNPIRQRIPAFREAGAGVCPTLRQPIRRSRPPARCRDSVAATPNAAARGTTIIVGTSDTLDSAGAPLQCFDRGDTAGQWLQGPPCPVTGAAADHSAADGDAVAAPAPVPAVAPPASKPVAAAPAAASVHVVNKGDTLHSIAHRNHIPVAELARANNLDQSARLSLGMKLTVPGAKTAAAAPAVAPAPAAPAAPAGKIVATAPPQSARGWFSRPRMWKSRLRLRRHCAQAGRSHRRAADLPLAGARQGHHQLRLQDQRQGQ